LKPAEPQIRLPALPNYRPKAIAIIGRNHRLLILIAWQLPSPDRNKERKESTRSDFNIRSIVNGRPNIQTNHCRATTDNSNNAPCPLSSKSATENETSERSQTQKKKRQRDEDAKMIKLFTLKQQKKDGEQKGSQQKKSSAAQLRIQKGNIRHLGYPLNINQLSMTINHPFLDAFHPPDINELNLPNTCATDFPDPDDLLNFKLIISPDEGFYRDGRFVFNFRVGSNYPHEPPKVKCATQVYHPNIDLEGNVCLNILREDWNPVLNINSIVYGLQFLFLVRMRHEEN